MVSTGRRVSARAETCRGAAAAYDVSRYGPVRGSTEEQEQPRLDEAGETAGRVLLSLAWAS